MSHHIMMIFSNVQRKLSKVQSATVHTCMYELKIGEGGYDMI